MSSSRNNSKHIVWDDNGRITKGPPLNRHGRRNKNCKRNHYSIMESSEDTYDFLAVDSLVHMGVPGPGGRANTLGAEDCREMDKIQQQLHSKGACAKWKRQKRKRGSGKKQLSDEPLNEAAEKQGGQLNLNRYRDHRNQRQRNSSFEHPMKSAANGERARKRRNQFSQHQQHNSNNNDEGVPVMGSMVDPIPRKKVRCLVEDIHEEDVVPSLPIAKTQSPSKGRPKPAPNAATAASKQSSPTIDLCDSDDDDKKGSPQTPTDKAKHRLSASTKSPKDLRHYTHPSSKNDPSGHYLRNIAENVLKAGPVPPPEKHPIQEGSRTLSFTRVDSSEGQQVATPKSSSSASSAGVLRRFTSAAGSAARTVTETASEYLKGTFASSPLSGKKLHMTVVKDAKNKKKKNTAGKQKITAGKPIVVGQAIAAGRAERKTASPYGGKENDESSPRAIRTSPRPLTRSQRKKNERNKNEVICVEDSDDDEVKEVPHVVSQDVLRIAIGSKVFDDECKVTLRGNDAMELSFLNEKRKDRSLTIRFTSDVREVKCFTKAESAILGESIFLASSEETATFIAMRVHRSPENGLGAYSCAYKVEDNAPDEKRYVVIELRTDDDCKVLLESIKTYSGISPYFESGCQLAPEDVAKYSASLINFSKKPAKRSRRRGMPSPRRGFLKGKKDDDLLLTYPFPVDRAKLDDAADGLKELSAVALDGSGAEMTTERENGEKDEDVAQDEEKRGRAHYVEIRVEDFDRLEQGEFLNDTLIDFFMQWMTRGDTSGSTHIFSTHFYTTLEREGPAGVTKWTKRKGIDIFKLKFIMIPINKNLHWSMCVVVNPGHVMNLLDFEKGDKTAGMDHLPRSCLFFFDSLKAHRKSQVQRNVTKWLNSEWQRIKESPKEEGPFACKSFKILTPRIPYQNNTWDCGVFVCRYAYALYQLRNRRFSFDELEAQGRSDFIEIISGGPEFLFTMDDIARIRGEMKTLIERLSGIYLPWSEQAKLEEVKAKAEARRKGLDNPKPEPESSQDSPMVTMVKRPKTKLQGSSDDESAYGEEAEFECSENVPQTSRTRVGALSQTPAESSQYSPAATMVHSPETKTCDSSEGGLSFRGETDFERSDTRQQLSEGHRKASLGRNGERSTSAEQPPSVAPELSAKPTTRRPTTLGCNSNGSNEVEVVDRPDGGSARKEPARITHVEVMFKEPAKNEDHGDSGDVTVLNNGPQVNDPNAQYASAASQPDGQTEIAPHRDNEDEVQTLGSSSSTLSNEQCSESSSFEAQASSTPGRGNPWDFPLHSTGGPSPSSSYSHGVEDVFPSQRSAAGACFLEGDNGCGDIAQV